MRLGISVALLPLDEHRRIDEATRRFSSASGDRVVEGRFLDFVLANLQQMMLVRVTCDRDVCESRFRNRQEPPGDQGSLEERERADRELAFRLYGALNVRAEPQLIVDTTDLSPAESARIVLEEIHSSAH